MINKIFKKRDQLIEIENNIRSKNNYCATIDINKKKFFATFPYPYMNGLLHLGHAYTLTKIEYMCRFKKLCGFNVLFPFGFHGTGMPIVACSQKLSDELRVLSANTSIDSLPNNSQIKILGDMEISQEEMQKFIDPHYWLKYFPQQATEDLKKFGAAIDFSRSFITTDINPYYDLFVKWQFDILNKKNLLKYGKRYVIYSEKDSQPCADHDRMSGEGAIPIEYKILVVESKDKTVNFLVTLVKDNVNIDVNIDVNIYINNKDQFVKFRLDDKIYVCNIKSFNNIRNQIDKIMYLEPYLPDFESYSSSNCSKGTGIYLSETDFIEPENITNVNSSLRYFEPSEKVISRSGDICVVAKTDQWFIDYGNEILKKKVNEFIDNHFTTTNDQTKLLLRKASDWINEWPCSRHYGLGTKLLNTSYVIDSLSDSTIYMAFYTISHLIDKIPLEKITTNFWNQIFLKEQLNSELYNQEELQLINQMKNEFEYWYPVDLRVSGKDLINNHLIMSLYNHLAVWNDIKFCPKRFELNGHIMLNGHKMSKSTGNFKTIRTAISQYGCDVTRLTLAEGDGIEDADFRDIIADGNLKKLYSEKEWFEEIINNFNDFSNKDEYNFWDIVFDIEIIDSFTKAFEFYNNYKFRSVVYESFYKILSARDKYRILYEKKHIPINKNLMKKFIDCSLLILYPICPHIVEYLWEKMENNKIQSMRNWFDINDPYTKQQKIKYNYYSNNIFNILNKINSDITRLTKKKRNINNIRVIFYKHYTNTELRILNEIRNIDMEWKDFVNIKIKKMVDDNIFSQCAKFGNFVKGRIDKFGWECFENRNTVEEYDLCKKWIPVFLNTQSQITFELQDVCNSVMFKYGPDEPQIILT